VVPQKLLSVACGIKMARHCTAVWQVPESVGLIQRLPSGVLITNGYPTVRHYVLHLLYSYCGEATTLGSKHAIIWQRRSTVPLQ